MTESADPQVQASRPAEFSAGYSRYALGLLCVVYIINFVDRQVLSILLQSIKEELSLSDVQLGLLSGTAFGIFYATLGIPIARLADIFSRKWVVVVSLSVWSGMTALCGTANNFLLLLLYRTGVGVGEAGGSPPAHSMISDLFPPEKRGTALGIFSLGVPIGILVGLLAGGWLDEALGWRMAFVVVGLPGLALALVVALTLREPPRGLSEDRVSEAVDYTAREVIQFLWRSRAFRYTAGGSGLYAFVGYSFVTWAPSFLMRSHAMESGEVGTWLALIIGIGGGVGVILGGIVSDRWARKTPSARVLVPAIAMIAGLPFWVPVYLTENVTISLLCMVPPAGLGLMYQAPAAAITQALATPNMRATAAATLLFIINIIGLAMGPAATGALSDLLEASYGEDSLRYALLAVSMILAPAGLMFWKASYFLDADYEFTERATIAEAERAHSTPDS